MTRKTMAPIDWVRLAASTDTARPALCSLHVTDTVAEASDGHRLHRIRNEEMDPGLWDIKTGALVDAKYPYPDTDRCFYHAVATQQVIDTKMLIAVTAAACAYRKALGCIPAEAGVSFRADDGSCVLLDSWYVRDVLRGLPEYGDLRILVDTWSHGVRFDLPNGMTAVVMPIRGHGCNAPKKSTRFDVSDCMRSVDVEAVRVA